MTGFINRNFCTIAALLASVFGAAALVDSLVLSPAEKHHLDTVRILYVHVPCAWAAMGLYLVMAVLSGHLLFRYNSNTACWLRAFSRLCLLFGVLCILTGMIWAKPVWGTWWVWDPRLTAMLVLAFITLGIVLLQDSFEQPAKGDRAAAILCLFGIVNIPVIRFSVNWWASIHQKASLSVSASPAIDAVFLRPLWLSGIAVFLYIVAISCVDKQRHSKLYKAIKYD